MQITMHVASSHALINKKNKTLLVVYNIKKKNKLAKRHSQSDNIIIVLFGILSKYLNKMGNKKRPQMFIST